jgi:dissimilatory sulfite reductase related protein
MPTFQVGDLVLTTDEDGFIQKPELWSRQVAEALAGTEGIQGLSEEHWCAINYLRSYFLEYGSAPTIRNLVKATGMGLKHIYELFPSGPAMGACKVAGLPKPTGCV